MLDFSADKYRFAFVAYVAFRLYKPILEGTVGYGSVRRSSLSFHAAMNTAQYGRTFEDRTHVWVLKERPADVDDDVRIINVNVRGRRGNIVQVSSFNQTGIMPIS